jgi:short subunit dehydrogenase-like uncharacterized protein
MSSERPYDVIVFGATGFTGRLTAEYLAQKSKGSAFRWAIAGRSAARLAEVKAAVEAIDPSAANLGIIEASAGDPASLERMARSTRVVLTTVGPYAEHGEPVVAACVREGTDYVDITGEPDFVSGLLERYDTAARERGVRIVNCCGFDSIPHDLGALFTVSKLPANEPLVVEGFVRAKSMFSGGTWQSALGAAGNFRHRRKSRELRKVSSERKVHALRAGVRYERRLGAWVCPLPTIDPLIVLRSARALDAYGPDFRYGHYVQVRSVVNLAAMIGGTAAVIALAQIGPTRDLLRKLYPSGEGPSAEERARGWFEVTFRGKATSRQVITRVSGGEPGYGETAKMVAESALCLALDRERLPSQAGVLTPAVAMGELLLERLQQAGIRFEVIETTS